MLLGADDRVFVARRIDTPGAWQMPQGGIHPGERPREAAIRELAEEIGVIDAVIIAETKGWLSYDLPVELRAKVWSGKYRGQRQKWFAMRFTGPDSAIDLRAHRPEFSAWKWTKMDQLPRLIVPFKRQLYIDVIGQLGPAALAGSHCR